MSQVSCLEITVTIKALVSQFRLEVVAVVAELAERPAVVLGAERVAARVAAGAALVALACVEINR